MTPLSPNPYSAYLSSFKDIAHCERYIEFSALSNPRSDQVVADVFRQAFEQGKQDILNDNIKSIIENSGEFFISNEVRTMLLEKGVKLTRNDDGTVSLEALPVDYCEDALRHNAINDALKPSLLKDLADLVSSYDSDCIGLTAKNWGVIKMAFKSGDPVLKEQIIRHAVRDGKEALLSAIFDELRRDLGFELIDLSHIDLSNLTPRGLDLSYANFSNANLAGVDLTNSPEIRESDLTGANLVGAKLQKANFKNAVLCNADLTGANLAGANLTRVDVTGTIWGDADISNAIMDAMYVLEERAPNQSEEPD